MFLGSQIGAFANDIGSTTETTLISPYGGAYTNQFDGFDLGLDVTNFGTNTQNNVTDQATIDGPGGNVFDETLTLPSMAPGAVISILNGNTYAFSVFNLGGAGNYPVGLYTLTYTLDLGVIDDSDFDNVMVSTFSVVNESLASSNVDLLGFPQANNYPSNSTTEYQSCMMVQENNASTMSVQGMYFIPHTDTSLNELAGAEIFINAYQWDDAWVDLDDPSYQFDPFVNDAFQNLNLITFGTHYPSSNNEVNDVAYATFGTPFTLQDSVRYLFCLQTFESATISFGYDNTVDYGGNVASTRQPTSPVHVDGSWYVNGWLGLDAPSIALKLSNCPGLAIDTTLLVETCFGQAEGAISVEATGFSGPLTYLWSTGSTNDTNTDLAGGAYSVNITDTSGCSMTATYTVLEFSEMDLTIGSVDETCFATNDGSAGIMNVNGGQPAYTYLWSTAETTMSISGLDNGVYSLTVTDALGCPVTEQVSIGTLTPDFSLAVQANTVLGYSPLLVDFENQTPSASNYNFTWIFGDGDTEQNNASIVSHTYLLNGVWDVTLIAEDITTGCIDTLDLNGYIVTSSVSISEMTEDGSFSIQPNPNNGIFVIKTDEVNSPSEVKIFNPQGQVVYSKSFVENEMNIDIQDLTPGVYIIHVWNENSEQISRIVKQ